MEHKGTIVLETKRLILRPFQMEDAAAMHANWASDPEVTKYLTWPTHETVEISGYVLRDWTSRYGDPAFYQWAIVLKENGSEPIGSIGVVEKIDDTIQKVHIGYCIGRKWWHQGITSEALDRLIQFFFEAVGVKKVESRHDSRNPHSGAVMVKCGMKQEGILRQADWNNQGVCDACYYGILADEWRGCFSGGCSTGSCSMGADSTEMRAR